MADRGVVNNGRVRGVNTIYQNRMWLYEERRPIIPLLKSLFQFLLEISSRATALPPSPNRGYGFAMISR